ncbi:transposase [Oscillibacter valericigenes]|nr:transposase [Oscillibacter valericigenes]
MTLFTSQSAAAFYDKLFSSLDFTLPRAATGRRGFPKEAMVCEFIVMKCEGFSQITDLVDYLDNNRIIAHYCGFNIMEPLPSYWTYDRFLRQLNNGALKSIMANLVRKLYELGIVDASFIGLDSTPVMANTKQNNPKSFAKNKFSKENHPKSDPDCALGVHSASNQHNERRYEFYWGYGNVKKCAVGKHPKSEKHSNTAQFSEVERSGTQENCGGIGSGCRLRPHPLPVLRRRQSQRVARIDPNAVVVDKNIAKNDRFDLFSRQFVRRDLIDLLFLERGEKALHPCVVEAMSGSAEALYHAAARQLRAKSRAGVLTPAI